MNTTDRAKEILRVLHEHQGNELGNIEFLTRFVAGELNLAYTMGVNNGLRDLPSEVPLYKLSLFTGFTE